jgi:hypothetical protein
VRRILFGETTALSLHEAVCLAREWGGTVSSKLVSEEDVSLMVEFVAQEPIDLGLKHVGVGETMTIQFDLHVGGIVAPRIAERFLDLTGGPTDEEETA